MYNKPRSTTTHDNMSGQLLLRIAGLYIAIALLSLFLGIGVFFILFGLVNIVLWFATDWEPAYLMTASLLRIRPTSGGFTHRRKSLWRTIWIWLKIVVIVYCIYIGINILYTQGFLGQNPFYLLLSS